MALSRLQTIMFFELRNGPKTGYEIRKAIKENSLQGSHQQIYRELTKMAIPFDYIHQDGKPDKKVYRLPNGYQPVFDISVIDIEILLTYQYQPLIEEKLQSLFTKLNELDELDKDKVNLVDNFRAKQILLTIETLSSLTE